MLKFDAGEFYWFVNTLSEHTELLEFKKRLKEELTDDDKTREKDLSTSIEDHLLQIQLQISSKHTSSMKNNVETLNPSIDSLLKSYETLKQIVGYELEEMVFLRLPAEKADYFNNPSLFGDLVHSKFPRLSPTLMRLENAMPAGGIQHAYSI